MLKEIPEPTLASTSDSLSQVMTPRGTPPQNPPSSLTLQALSSTLTSKEGPFAATPGETQDPPSNLASGNTSPASTLKDFSFDVAPEETPHDPLSGLTPENTASILSSEEHSFDATPGETPQEPLSSLMPESPSSASTRQDHPLPSAPVEAKGFAADQVTQHYSPPNAPSGMLPVYNVLLLGPTQSGKSTFLENVKQYSNPWYKINTTRIGIGNVSHTQTGCVEDVITTLPIYKVYDENGLEFDSRSIKDEWSFKRFLNRDDDLELRPVELPGSPKVRFRIFDTPGLNDTNGNDIENIASTFSTLSEVGHLNLIIITDSHHVPLNPSQQDAFKTYFNLFKDLKGLITVVHTHSPNKFRVPGMNIMHDRKLKGRSEFFNQIMGREVPTKRIDCDPNETGPANLCMTRNAIREILEMAKVKAPVTINTTHVYKTPFMVHVDRSVRDAYRAKLNESLKKCRSTTQKLSVEIEEVEEEIKDKNKDIDEHDTDEMLPLFEKRFDEEVGFFSWWADLAGRADKLHTMELPDQEYTIDEINVAKKAIHILDETGGCGHKSWNVKFKRDQYSTGYYHAVLKMKKSTRYQKDIEGWRSEVECLKEELKLKKQGLATLESQEAIGSSGNSSNEFVKLMNLIAKSRMIIGIAADETLPLELFMDLAKARVYRQDDNGGSTREHHRILEQHAEKMLGREEVAGQGLRKGMVRLESVAIYLVLFGLAYMFGGFMFYSLLAIYMAYEYLTQ